jgi:hypothetical protein
MRRVRADEALLELINEFRETHSNDIRADLDRSELYMTGCFVLRMKYGRFKNNRMINMYDAEHYTKHPWIFSELMENMYGQLVKMHDGSSNGAA